MTWGQMYASMEDERIRKHLENTEIWMRKKDCSHLTEELKIAREDKINLLHEYWKAGNFPINTDFPKTRLPHIKDRFGTPCAMAYLIEESGDKQLVEQLEKTNNVFIKDVSEGPLITWLETSGITKEEACQIQPTYQGGICEDKFGKQIKWQGLGRFDPITQKIISPKPKACVKDVPLPICEFEQPPGSIFMGTRFCRPKGAKNRRDPNPRDRIIIPNLNSDNFRQRRRSIGKLARGKRRSARASLLKEEKSADRKRLKAKAAQVIAARKARRKPLTTRTRRRK